MTVYFGTDSAADVRTLAAALGQAFGTLPSWVGRYLGDGGAGATPLSSQEVAWLLSNGVRVLAIWNNAGPGDVASSQAHGTEHGQLTVAALAALHAPTGIPVALDIEASWSPTAAFLAGWASAVHAAGYNPIVYCSVTNAQHVAAWREAQTLAGMVIALWSSEPEYTAEQDVVLATWQDFSEWLGAEAAYVHYHQYGEGELGDRVDYDLATEQGYGALWSGAPVPAFPRRRQAIAECGLKPQPAHGGANLAMIPASGQLIDFGNRQDGWAAVQWTRLYGWILADNIDELQGATP